MGRFQWRFLAVVAALYFGLAELAYRLVLLPSPAGPVEFRWLAILVAAAGAVHLLSTLWLVRRLGRLILAHSAGAAAVGAATALVLGAWRVEWGQACNQCLPGATWLLGTTVAAAVAAALSLAVVRFTRLRVA